METFSLTRPVRGDTAVLVEVPHAGLALPDDVRDQIAVPRQDILKDADLYVDRLYQDAPDRGATLLVAHVSRYVVDLNRAPNDVDARAVPSHPSPQPNQPRGVIWRMTTDGRSVLRQPLSLAQFSSRIETFHRPYHEALTQELARIRDRFGHAILLAAHSMPSIGRAGHTDTGSHRADVVPGTRGRSSADGRLIDLVDAHFREAGLSVRHDDPYKGGWTTGHYGRPQDRWHAIQIELARGLYMNEETTEPRPADFDKLSKLLMELVVKLGAAF